MILELIMNHISIWWRWFLKYLNFEEEFEEFEGSFEQNQLVNI